MLKKPRNNKIFQKRYPSPGIRVYSAKNKQFQMRSLSKPKLVSYNPQNTIKLNTQQYRTNDNKKQHRLQFTKPGHCSKIFSRKQQDDGQTTAASYISYHKKTPRLKLPPNIPSSRVRCSNNHHLNNFNKIKFTYEKRIVSLQNTYQNKKIREKLNQSQKFIPKRDIKLFQAKQTTSIISNQIADIASYAQYYA